eukprot:TRINITY_DN1983_c0_g1_i1.p1 TRINITY_DN1983_c0_g1~~TRINITY_DN1983_c0_g1_i1.p1  ORF type:complete len:390 (+),score=56.11 TRINITY_DN1983_c0_g1_i1:32-1201(+)
MATAGDGVFHGLSIVFTGKFSKTRAQLQRTVIQNGGFCPDSVTRHVDVLIATEDEYNKPTTKVANALRYNVDCVIEQWLYDSITAQQALPRANYLWTAVQQALPPSPIQPGMLPGVVGLSGMHALLQQQLIQANPQLVLLLQQQQQQQQVLPLVAGVQIADDYAPIATNVHASRPSNAHQQYMAMEPVPDGPVVHWLLGLGLDKYAPLFHNQEINDLDTMSRMTDDNLLKIGVDLVGPRMKLLAAIEELRITRSRDCSDPPENRSISVADIGATAGLPAEFSSSEWMINPSQLKLGVEIGRGFFGVVHKGQWQGQTVAVKRLYRSLPRGEMEMFARECRIIASLRSPYIVLFMGVCVASDVFMLTEFMDRGSLHEVLQEYVCSQTWPAE